MKTQTQGFLEVTIFDDESADIRDGSGVVDIGESDRVFVALALLGGITDELVKKAVVGALNGPGINDDADWEAINSQVEPLIRGAINAVFGIVEP